MILVGGSGLDGFCYFCGRIVGMHKAPDDSLLLYLSPNLRMKKETSIHLFEAKQIRSAWSEEDQKWYLSVMDVIETLTGTDRPRKY